MSFDSYRRRRRRLLCGTPGDECEESRDKLFGEIGSERGHVRVVMIESPYTYKGKEHRRREHDHLVLESAYRP